MKVENFGVLVSNSGSCRCVTGFHHWASPQLPLPTATKESQSLSRWFCPSEVEENSRKNLSTCLSHCLRLWPLAFCKQLWHLWLPDCKPSRHLSKFVASFDISQYRLFSLCNIPFSQFFFKKPFSSNSFYFVGSRVKPLGILCYWNYHIYIYIGDAQICSLCWLNTFYCSLNITLCYYFY